MRAYALQVSLSQETTQMWSSPARQDQLMAAHHVFLLSIRKLSANVGPESISIVAVTLVT